MIVAYAVLILIFIGFAVFADKLAPVGQALIEHLPAPLQRLYAIPGAPMRRDDPFWINFNRAGSLVVVAVLAFLLVRRIR